MKAEDILTKFGVKIVQAGYSYEQISSLCLAAEATGFDSFWVADHMYSWKRKPTDRYALESTTILSSLAALTSRIRLGTLVICNLFRHPAVLAKVASSIDSISKGRLELGMGAGGPSTPAELSGFGMAIPKRRERIERLAEAIQVVKAMWSEDIANYTGRYYKLSGVINNPKPVQKPHPRIWVGGERDDVLHVAAKYANGWNCRRYSPDAFKERVRALEALSSKTMEKSWQGSILLGKSESDLAEKKQRYGVEEGAIAGTCEQVIAKIQEYVNAGATYFMFHFHDDLEPGHGSLALFHERVAPNFS